MRDTSQLPIKNKFVYCYRVGIKILSFICFGATSVILGVLLLPLMRLCIHPADRFRQVAHLFVSYAFRIGTNILHILGVSSLSFSHKKELKNIHSKIIVANHPSYLDMVYIISLVPNLDMIVRGSLTKGILGAVVRQIYIVNTENYDVLKEHCVHTLQSGNCLLIFPEGSRTPRNHHIPYKKGAARIALASGCSIIPLRIWGNDKYGIGKGDPLFSYNHREKYWYDITMLPAIDPKDFTDLAEPTAAKRIMDKVKSEIGNTVITETEDR